MLYTIVPFDVVMRQKNTQNYEDRMVNGVCCTLEKVKDSQYRIVRVWSTDPAIYLDPAYQPGKKIKL